MYHYYMFGSGLRICDPFLLPATASQHYTSYIWRPTFYVPFTDPCFSYSSTIVLDSDSLRRYYYPFCVLIFILSPITLRLRISYIEFNRYNTVWIPYKSQCNIFCSNFTCQQTHAYKFSFCFAFSKSIDIWLWTLL